MPLLFAHEASTTPIVAILSPKISIVGGTRNMEKTKREARAFVEMQ